MKKFLAVLFLALACGLDAEATVPGTYAPNSYACNGVTGTFSVTFPYLAYTQVSVTTTTAGGTTTALAYTTDFSVDKSSSQSVATLSLVAPASSCPAGNTLRIFRHTPLTQPYGFRAQNNYNQALHETAYDNLCMQIQEALYGQNCVPTAKGDLCVADASATSTRLPVGANGSVLTADSTQTLGVTWGTINSSLISNPLGLNLAHFNAWTAPQSVTVNTGSWAILASQAGVGDAITAATTGAGPALDGNASAGTGHALTLFSNTNKAPLYLGSAGASDPTTPIDSTVWSTGTAIKARLSGVTYTLAPAAAKGEYNFSAFKHNFAFNAGPTLSQSKCTNAATVTADSTITEIQPGFGAGNLVVKLCTDGTTCAGANTLLTCTIACASSGVPGVAAACTVNNAACAAGTTVTWSYASACSAGNQDPWVNVNAHFTIP